MINSCISSPNIIWVSTTRHGQDYALDIQGSLSLWSLQCHEIIQTISGLTLITELQI